MKNFKLLFALLAVLAIGIMSFTVVNSKHTAAKEVKKFATVTYFYIGPLPATSDDLKDPDNWVTTGGPCGEGTNVICSITFDTDTYPLTSNKPSITFLTNQVAIHYNDGTSTQHSFTVNGVTYTRRTS